MDSFILQISAEVEEIWFIYNALVVDFIEFWFLLQLLFIATNQHTEEVLLTYLKNFFKTAKIPNG